MLNDISKKIEWSELDSIIKSKQGLEHVSYREFEKMVMENVENIHWESCLNWEAYSDIQLVKMLDQLKQLSGMSVIVTEVSYLKDFGPFICEASRLDDFSELYYHELGECLFNGDLVIINIKSDNVWIFSHEGVYTAFSISEVFKGSDMHSV